jgi:L-histidine N-alpha-methyltransferase
MTGPTFIQIHREDDAALRRELAAGLLEQPARVAPKFLYDALGSRLFDAITELPEYYPTRTERALFEAHGAAMAAACGRGRTLVDLGAGSCEKAERLFDALQPRRYIPVDISVDYLRHTLQALQQRHPHIEMLGVGLDFSVSLALPPEAGDEPKLVFYPGSSIGKPPDVLELAYADPLGVTAAFNLNLLRRLAALIGCDARVEDFAHVALFDPVRSRIEMHLEARRDVVLRWPGGERRLAAGERMHTENSYKYTVESFDRLLREAGFTQTNCWTDERRWFAVFAAA